MTSAAAPLDDVRDISKLAYGFMASKALFVALEIDVFGSLAAAPKKGTPWFALSAAQQKALKASFKGTKFTQMNTAEVAKTRLQLRIGEATE